jgi:V8-like Glu-specific endopeptidase
MDIQKSIVAILNNKKKIIGTGFVAGENLILTCAHVVKHASSALNNQVVVRLAWMFQNLWCWLT